MAEFSTSNHAGLPTDGCTRWEEFAADHRVPAPVRMALDHALAEHLQNIVNHSRATRVSIRFEALPDSVSAMVSDDGVAFDPTAAPLVDTSAPIEERPIGGLGIHMMRRLCDHLVYLRVGGTNQLELIKRVRAS